MADSFNAIDGNQHLGVGGGCREEFKGNGFVELVHTVVSCSLLCKDRCVSIKLFGSSTGDSALLRVSL